MFPDTDERCSIVPGELERPVARPVPGTVRGVLSVC